jgi:hypothetical protein
MNRKSARLPIRLDKRVVGFVEGDRFVKRARGSIHMLRKPPSWAIDCSIIARLKGMGVRTLEVIDTENNAAYSTTLEHFETHSFELDRGFGRQRALVLSGWTCKSAPLMRSDLRQTGQRQSLFDFRGEP